MRLQVHSSLRILTAISILVLVLGILASGPVISRAHAADGETVVIGSGTAAGVYFPAAGAICQRVNSARGDSDPTCVVVPGEGSKASLEALRAGDLDFAIVQSDWQFWAHKGADFFADPTPFTSLSSVFALHAEPLVIAARRDAGVVKLADLKGKRMSVGSPGSAARGMTEDLLAALGWSMSDFAEAQEMTPRQQTAALCDNSLDAAVYAVGSPSATLAALTAQCAVSFVPVGGEAIDNLLKEKPFYRTTAIPAAIYAGVDDAVPTFGVGATLVTRAELADATVTALVAAVLDDLAAFRALHPALTWLDAEQMARAGLSVPLHPAAARYFASKEGS